jgi:hypothetical protein
VLRRASFAGHGTPRRNRVTSSTSDRCFGYRVWKLRTANSFANLQLSPGGADVDGMTALALSSLDRMMSAS